MTSLSSAGLKQVLQNLMTPRSTRQEVVETQRSCSEEGRGKYLV